MSETEQEQKPEWKTYIFCRRIMAVATQGGAGDDWSAYIGIVPGKSHRKEWPLVLSDGDKLEHKVAKLLFPKFDEKYRWRG